MIDKILYVNKNRVLLYLTNGVIMTIQTDNGTAFSKAIEMREMLCRFLTSKVA
jgi:hypothetical protein